MADYNSKVHQTHCVVSGKHSADYCRQKALRQYRECVLSGYVPNVRNAKTDPH